MTSRLTEIWYGPLCLCGSWARHGTSAPVCIGGVMFCSLNALCSVNCTGKTIPTCVQSAYRNGSCLGRLSFWLGLLPWDKQQEFVFLGGYSSVYTIFVTISISCDEVWLIFHVARAGFQIFLFDFSEKIIYLKSFFCGSTWIQTKKVSAQMLFLRFLMLKNIIPCSCSAEVIQSVFWSRRGYLFLKRSLCLNSISRFLGNCFEHFLLSGWYGT